MTNTQVIERESVDLAPRYDGPEMSAPALIMDGESIDRMMRVAEIMATGKATVPQHLRSSPGDCMAVVMQAMQWKMNPFAVAQKTHLVNGTLGYEAQLVNAVCQSTGAIDGRFHYEYKGEGAQLECRVGAVLHGEADITWGEWLSFGSVTTKNSPLWKTNPKQQLGYLQVKNWARSYAPGAILGVYTPEELADRPKERDITPAGEYQEEPVQPATRTAALKERLSGKHADGQRNPAELSKVIELIAGASSGTDLHAAKEKIKNLTHEKDAAEALQAYAARVNHLQGMPQLKDGLIGRAKSANTDDELNIIADEARKLPDALAQEVYDAVSDRREVI